MIDKLALLLDVLRAHGLSLAEVEARRGPRWESFTLRFVRVTSAVVRPFRRSPPN